MKKIFLLLLATFLLLLTIRLHSEEEYIIIQPEPEPIIILTEDNPSPSDTTPPTGSITINNGNPEYTNSVNVVLYLTYNDISSGVSYVRYGNDRSVWTTWETPSATKNWTLSAGDGLKTVYYEVKDTAGNIAQFTDIIIVDTVPPTGSITINNGNPIYTDSTDVVLYLVYNDSGSGVSLVRYGNNGDFWTPWESPSATKNWKLPSGDGTKTVYYEIKDKADNVSQYTDIIIFITPDTTPPIASILINNNATYTSTVSVILTLSATDSETGITGMRIWNNTDIEPTTWELYAVSKEWKLLSGDGTKTVNAKFKNGQGLETLVTDDIILDATPPTGSITINSGNPDYTNSADVVLYLTYSDAGSGVSYVRYGNDGGVWTDWETPSATRNWTLSEGNGVKTVYYEIKDTAGNIAQFTDTIILETIIQATIVINPDTLNLKSKGKWITAYIELPLKYDVKNIDVSSVLLNGLLKAEEKPTNIGDDDNDGIPDLMVKFSREEAQKILCKGEDVKLTVKGNVGGIEFTGDDTIKVIEPGKSPEESKTELSKELEKPAVKPEIKPNKEIEKPAVEPKEPVESAIVEQLKEKIVHFKLEDKIPAEANIREVILWVELGNKKETLEVYYNNLFQNKYVYHNKYTDKPGMGWDITENVVKDKDISLSVKYSENISVNCVLIVVYEIGTVSDNVILFNGGKITLKENKKIQVTEKPKKETDNLKAFSQMFEFEKTDLTKPVTITLYYDDTNLGDIKEADLKIYSYNETTSQWEPLNCEIDTEKNTITVITTKLSSLQVMTPSINKTATPARPSLGQNYPNPFNPETTINYFIEKDCYVTLKLYNICGQLVTTIVDEFQTAGAHTIHFDGKDLSRGIYYYQLKAGDFVATKKMVVLK